MAVVTISQLSEVITHQRLDAEFYQPQYAIDFTKGDWRPIKTFLDICQYGISQIMSEKPVGPPIFRMDDIKDCFLEDDEVKYVEIPEKVSKLFRLRHDDILFNRVNSEEFVGRTGIFKLEDQYVFASYLIRLRIKPNSEILPDYLNMFLNSLYGKKQIRRFSRRAVNQANVNAQELKNFRVCVIPEKTQEQIRKLCNEAWAKIGLSKSLYDKAEEMLLRELGLQNFKPAYPVSFTSTLSDVATSQRVDAEYFQPAYKSLIDILRAKPHYIIRDIQIFNSRGIQPKYVDKGDMSVVTSKRLGRRSIDYENLEAISQEYFDGNPEAQIKKFDILIYTTGAYVGLTNCYLDSEPALASNHVNILRIRELNPIYVAVFLNSILGQMQVRRLVSGSAQVELYPSDVAKFVIWHAPQTVQEQIAELVQKSHEAQRKARELIEESITTTEKAVTDEAGR